MVVKVAASLEELMTFIIGFKLVQVSRNVELRIDHLQVEVTPTGNYLRKIDLIV